MTRGLPITAAVLGSLYFARTRLPAQYHFGPKGWPFYAIMGIGTLTTVNVFSMGSCRERVQPLIARMWQKVRVSSSFLTLPFHPISPFSTISVIPRPAMKKFVDVTDRNKDLERLTQATQPMRGQECPNSVR